MEKIFKAIDTSKKIGEVTLSDGSVISLPKITISKLFEIAAFICKDGNSLWKDIREIFAMNELGVMERLGAILAVMKPEHLVKIHSILLEIDAGEVLYLDHDEMLEITVEYLESINMGKTYSSIQRLAKVFNKNLPDWDQLMAKLDSMIPEEETSAGKDS
ncbi:TPA: hypothetical protein ROY11_004534 [Bacillus cereus]|uniref:hypothetical protein n=2 Tax=Bacteria TaxID=2 RepID=UPI0011ED6835|nr:hypothetical protein [Bacillus sp. BB56-3]KAA0782569.1 hypothetical protein DN406_29235 [Bacillus sp. BB56-3]HDX9607395.1 hypothetical protein [Bacillus cereus]